MSGALTLAELVDFCIEHDIDQTKVTFDYGHKEVVAVFEHAAHAQLLHPEHPKFEDLMNQLDDYEYPKGYPEGIYWSSNYGEYVMSIW